MTARTLRLFAEAVSLIVLLSFQSAYGSGTEYYSAPEPQAFQFDQSHTKWAELLEKVIIRNPKPGQNELDTTALKKNRKLLDAYLESVESVALTEFNDFSKTEQTAFIVNAFNAFSLAATLKDSMSSLKTLDSTARVTVFSDSYSASEFTAKFIKRRLADPRALLALYCFDQGCPAPYKEALVPEKLEVQLTGVISSFMSDRSKNNFDSASKRIFLSPVFKKYESEFAKKYGSLGAFAGKFLISDPSILRKARSGMIRIEFPGDK